MLFNRMVNKTATKNLDELFKIGAHFGFSKSRRHPSMEPFIFGSKNRVDIFDLEKTNESLQRALNFVSSIISNGGTILFVGGKNEAQESIREVAQSVKMPYVASRWIGGTLTNHSEIWKRVEATLNLLSQKERGELSKYTKRERLLIDKKIEKLQKMFWGIKDMSFLPKAIFIVDPRYEETALKEARSLKIPVVALCGSDNNASLVDYPIGGNDTNVASIKYFVNKIAEACQVEK